MTGIGHNSGRVDEPGNGWRRYAWTKARKDLVPTLPIEVVRLRVRRAAQLGLPYKTYAGIRACTGHDLIGFLFSNNALQVLRDGQRLPDTRAEKLVGLIQTQVIGAAHPPVTPAYLAQLPGVQSSFSAPSFRESWSEMRDQLCRSLCSAGNPADRYVIVGDTAFEREWSEAARTAGYLRADQFFSA